MHPIFSHRIEVRFRDCDPMGHVNNAVYLTYLEQARFAHWRALWGFQARERGWSSSSAEDRLGEEMPGVILAHADIDYRLPARYGDVLEVRIGLAALGRTSFTYEYEILDENARVVATAKSVQVMYDYAAGKPVPVPDPIRARLSGK
jgi:acyl-CoA thioester hydrolase